MCAMTADRRSSSEWNDQRLASRPQVRRRSGGGRWMVALVFLLAVGAAGTAAVAYFFAPFGGPDEAKKVLTAEVKEGDLVITVTEDGNVESASNVELKCEVAGTTTILDIVEDGKHVKKGDILVRFDGSTIQDSVNQQKILVAKAEAAKISAEKTWSAATIAVNGYLEGTFLHELQTAESNITIAQENLSSAKNILEHTSRMARKGYVTPLQLEAQEFAVKRAELDLSLQENTKMVLEKYTKAQTLEELYSARDSAEAQMKSELAAYDLEASKLKRLETQLEKSIIKAPQDGMVVYANDNAAGRWGGQQGPKVELGAQVREYQSILRLPDLKNMQVKVLVHESKVDQLRPGLPASIKIQDRQLQGRIISIANQAEQGGSWFGNVKEYGTVVKIEGTPEDLKPGMTAQVEILIAEKKNVLKVPVQCVVEKGNKFHAYVKTPTGISEREVLLGATNDTMIEVKDGLNKGERVLQNPRAIVAAAREDVQLADTVDVQKKFGATAEVPQDAPTAGQGSAAQGAGPPGAAGGAPLAGGPGGPGGLRGPGGGGPGGGGGGARQMDFATLDKNGDGKIAKDEMPERAQQFFDFMDSNKDGFVDKAESDARRARAQQGGGADGPGGFGGGGGAAGGGGGPGGGGGRRMMDLAELDKDGDGKMSKAEAPEWMQQFFDGIDSNADGFVDKAEMDAWRARFQQRRGGGPGGGPGGGGAAGGAP